MDILYYRDLINTVQRKNQSKWRYTVLSGVLLQVNLDQFDPQSPLLTAMSLTPIKEQGHTSIFYSDWCHTILLFKGWTVPLNEWMTNFLILLNLVIGWLRTNWSDILRQHLLTTVTYIFMCQLRHSITLTSYSSWIQTLIWRISLEIPSPDHPMSFLRSVK